MSLWKFRSPVIFGMALAFSGRALVLAEPVALCAAALFLTAHYLDRFFSAERVDSKAMQKVRELDEELKLLRSDMSSVKLAQGMRGGR